MVSRLEVRLDEERRQHLEEMAQGQDTSIADLVRRMIDDAWDAFMLEHRRQLVREIASFHGDVPDDPQDLFRELESRFESDSLP